MESQVAILEEVGSLEPEDPGSAGAVVTRRLTGGLGGYTVVLCTTTLVQSKHDVTQPQVQRIDRL
jgi:hypothetical protein